MDYSKCLLIRHSDCRNGGMDRSVGTDFNGQLIGFLSNTTTCHNGGMDSWMDGWRNLDEQIHMDRCGWTTYLVGFQTQCLSFSIKVPQKKQMEVVDNSFCLALAGEREVI